MRTNIAILGRGRMGQQVQRCVEESDDLQVAGIWGRNGCGDVASILSLADVVVDFTLPAATEQVIAAAIDASVPLVSGVSGLTAAHYKQMTDAAERIPILHDRNMSLGIAVMQNLVKLAGSALGEQFEAEIHETHHVHKIDAPSGTALLLGETLAASRGQDFAGVYHYDHDGGSSPAPGDIHYEVARHGEVAGEHTVILRSASETLSLSHSVTDRRVFAVGAVNAARWLVKQAPGLYCIQDMVMNTSLFRPEVSGNTFR